MNRASVVDSQVHAGASRCVVPMVSIALAMARHVRIRQNRAATLVTVQIAPIQT